MQQTTLGGYVRSVTNLMMKQPLMLMYAFAVYITASTFWEDWLDGHAAECAAFSLLLFMSCSRNGQQIFETCKISIKSRVDTSHWCSGTAAANSLARQPHEMHLMPGLTPKEWPSRTSGKSRNLVRRRMMSPAAASTPWGP